MKIAAALKLSVNKAVGATHFEEVEGYEEGVGGVA